MSDPKVLFFDIETTPMLGYTFELFDARILELEDDWWILCFSYSWQDEGEVHVVSQPEFKRSYKRSLKDDYRVVKELWKRLDEADIVVGHNVRGFDIKKANARFMFHGLPSPSPYQSIDTLKIARSQAKISSNKLDFLGEFLGLGRKAKHEGIDTWFGCMGGNMRSWGLMTAYAAQDTILLQDVYRYFRDGGWIKGGPNMATISGDLHACPKCKTEGKMMKRGFKYTATQAQQQYQCMGCKSYSTERKPKTGPRFS